MPIFAWKAFPGGSEVKVSACNAGDLGSIPGSGRSPGEGNGNPLQHFCLENPMDGGAWWATVHRVAESDTTDWLHFYSHFHFACNVPLVSLIFLKRSLVFPILLFFSISLHWSLRKAFLSLLAILWNSAFKWVYLSFSPLLFTSLLFTLFVTQKTKKSDVTEPWIILINLVATSIFTLLCKQKCFSRFKCFDDGVT